MNPETPPKLPTQPTPVTPVASPQPPKPAASSRLLPFLLLILVVVIVGGGFYYYYSHRTTQPKAAAQTLAKPVPVLRIAIEGPFTNFYPAGEQNVGDTELQHDLDDALVQYENVTQIKPALAISWENPDKTTWVFHLRKNVLFHDGNTLTSADVVTSINLVLKDSTNTYNQFTSTIKSVVATDPLTVTITTNAPDPILLNELSELSILDSKDKTPYDPNAGTGPYMLKPGTTPAEKSISLVAFDKYWGGKPSVRELDYSDPGGSDAYAAALAAGHVDFAGDLTLAGVASLNKTSYATFKQETDSVYGIFFNVADTSSPLSKLAVRQAVLDATDPTAMIKARDIFGIPASQLLPELVPGFNPAIKRPAVNIAKAKQLLTQAGYPNGLTLTITYYSPGSDDAAKEAQRQLALAGITLKLDPITVISNLAAKVYGGKAQMWWLGESSSLLDMSDVVSSLLYKNVNYDNPQVDTLADQAATTFDSTARLKLLQQMSSVLASDVPVAPMYVPQFEYGFSNNLKNLTQARLDNTEGIEWWRVHE